MSQLSDMRSRIADDIADSSINTQIDKAINRAIEFYEAENFWFKDATASFTSVASQKVYESSDGIPTDIAEIEYVEITISSSDYELRPMLFTEYQRRDTGNVSGQPTHYAFHNEVFYLHPEPDDAYVVTVYYKKKYSALTSDTDTNDWTTDAEDLIEAHATWWIYNRVKKDYEAADRAAQEAASALKALRKKSIKLESTGKLKRYE